MIQKISAVISLGAGVSQMPLIERARQKGYRVIAVDRDETAVGFAGADERVLVSTHDTVAVIEALRALQSRYDFAGVVARVGERALYTAAAIAREFNLRGLTDDLVRVATEKSVLRQWCAEHQVLAPRGTKWSPTDPVDTPPALRAPLVVKPDATVNGKEGITVLKSPASLPVAIATASRASANGSVEVEEFIEGIDASCLFLASDGKADVITYWDELVEVTADGSIQGKGASVPTRVSERAKQYMAESAAVLAAQFPAVQALLIGSFRVGTDDRPYCIELHADLGGDSIADTLLRRALPEFDYFGLAVSVACEDHPRISRSIPRPTVMKDGILKNL